MTFTLSKKLLLAAYLLAVTQVHADVLDDVLKRGRLRVAVPQDSPPFGSVGVEMQLQGYDVDLARLLAADLGVGLELVPVSASNRVPHLQANKVDVIISSLGKSQEREKTVDFSIPYAVIVSGVYGPASLAVSKPEDLAGKSVGASRGSLEDLEISKLAPDAGIRRFEDASSTMQAFLSGQVQLVAATNTVVAVTLKRNPPVAPTLKFSMKISPSYVGVGKQERRMLDRINHLIVAKKKEGELSRMYLKWFGQPLPDMPEQ